MRRRRDDNARRTMREAAGWSNPVQSYTCQARRAAQEPVEEREQGGDEDEAGDGERPQSVRRNAQVLNCGGHDPERRAV